MGIVDVGQLVGGTKGDVEVIADIPFSAKYGMLVVTYQRPA
jgi:hypothetical protein